jgi:hypothetical protein
MLVHAANDGADFGGANVKCGDDFVFVHNLYSMRFFGKRFDF